MYVYIFIYIYIYIFRLNSCMLTHGKIVLAKKDLDKAIKDKKCHNFDEDTILELWFEKSTLEKHKLARSYSEKKMSEMRRTTRRVRKCVSDTALYIYILLYITIMYIYIYIYLYIYIYYVCVLYLLIGKRRGTL